MTTFLQFHFLTSYPASNLNRDDAGRPKTLIYGEANRLRVSSQSLKRAWRKSDFFEERMQGHIGQRSQRFAEKLFIELTVTHGLDSAVAVERIQNVLGKGAEGLGAFEKLPKKSDDPISAKHVRTSQLVHLGPNEVKKIEGLASELATGEPDTSTDLRVLSQDHGAVDIALFGRMLADQTRMNVEAACQVAHAFTTHRVSVEDDFYTAIDDLKTKTDGDDAGAGFLGSHDYGAGVFYTYVCLNAEQLVANLSGNAQLAGDAFATLIEAMCTIGPTGKQNSYASRSRAAYGMLEIGEAMPRSLAEAFLQPVRAEGKDLVSQSVTALENRKKTIDDVYGDTPTQEDMFNTVSGEGRLDAILTAARKAVVSVGEKG